VTGSRAGLSRRHGDGRPLTPVGHVHLGLGSFFRAHQAWYTERSPDRDEWGIAAFTGRSARLADTLTGQDALYTLVTRSDSADAFDVISSLSACHPAQDHESFLRYLSSSSVKLLTLTVTEAGYLADADGDPMGSVPARIVAGLAARRAADAGPLAIVSCDNLPDNGHATARVVGQIAEQVDPTLASWISESVSFVGTVVDRITPRLEAADLDLVAAATRRNDLAPVLTEPFSEWVLSGAFPAGRPAWQHAGASFTDDIAPFEDRKLWLLNGGHCLLAYAGSLRGHDTVAAAVADGTCRAWLEQWWDEAAAELSLPAADIAAYRASLLARFANGRLRYALAQIAGDGSQKLPVRVLPVVQAQRQRGLLPVGGLRILAGWLCHLRGGRVAVDDPRAAELVGLASGPLDVAARRVLTALDRALGDDDAVVATTHELAQECVSANRDRGPL
jgi:fructuronate reductase